MPQRRRIIVYISTSADGYIARPDGDVAWLDRPRPKGNYGMGEFYKSIDTILWGRKTYDQGIAMGMKASLFPPGIKNYVFSRTATLGCPPSPTGGTPVHRGAPPAGVHFEFVNEPVKEFAQRLRAQKGKDIWMMGGAGIVASFLDAGEIDEFQIHVIPKFIGEGIPLVSPRSREIPLELLESKAFPDGVVLFRYGVKR